jgi:DNA-binding NarL/FixJ family response regulator
MLSPKIKTIRVLLIDDHPVLLDSLAHYLSQHAQLEVVGKLAHGDQCIGCVSAYRPDVVVMDLSMPGLGVFERIHHLLKPVSGCAPALLILTSELGEIGLPELINAGARGYLAKDSDGNQLVAAIRALSEGSIYLHGDSPTLLKHRKANPVGNALSTREHQLLALMAQGCSNKEIATKLFLSTGTVKSYSSRLFEKLCVHGRTQAVLHAMRNGLISAAKNHSAHPA